MTFAKRSDAALLAAVLVALLVAIVLGVSLVAGDSSSDESSSCPQLIEDVIDGTKDRPISLLEVRSPEVTTDNRKDHKTPTGTEEVTLLACSGTAVWSSGRDTRSWSGRLSTRTATPGRGRL